MGIFDFFKKDKGKELFKENDAAEAKADAIRAEIKRMGLPGDLKVTVNGDKVKVSGNVPDQATKEKLMLIVGNTRHVASVDDDMVPGRPAAASTGAAPAARTGASGPVGNAPVQQAQPATRFYTVESGDTLSKISKEFYGEANKYAQIFEANKPMLKDPDEIYPGQVLRIPPENAAVA